MLKGKCKIEYELAVMIWNEFIVKTNNEKIDFSFKNLEFKIKKIIDNKPSKNKIWHKYAWMQKIFR